MLCFVLVHLFAEKGTMRVPRVGGTMTMTVSHKAWAKATTFLVFPVQGMPDNDVKKGMHNCR